MDNAEKETVAQREWRERHDPTIAAAPPTRQAEWFMTDTDIRGKGSYVKPGVWEYHYPNEEGVSADAKYIADCASQDALRSSGRIVAHLWIIFVLLPVVLAILFEILTHL
jgi:hypothetical protein